MGGFIPLCSFLFFFFFLQLSHYVLGGSRHKKQASTNSLTRGLPVPQSRWQPGETQEVGSARSAPSAPANTAMAVIYETIVANGQLVTVDGQLVTGMFACVRYITQPAPFYVRLRAWKLLPRTLSQPSVTQSTLVICVLDGEMPPDPGLNIQLIGLE